MPLRFVAISGFFHCFWSLLSETSQREGKDKNEIWKLLAFEGGEAETNSEKQDNRIKKMTFIFFNL